MILHLNEADANFKEEKPMKRTMKKHLSIILAVLMLLTSVGFNVIAASVCQHQTDMNNPKYQNVINPNCDEGGYTEYLCTLCGEVVSTGDFKDPLGHKYGEFKFEPIDENDLSKGYYKYQTCERQFVVEGKDEPVTCGLKSYETENNERAVYYLVKFVNNKVVGNNSYDESIKYTAVADIAKYESEELYSEYVKKGDEAIYEGEQPFTGKTKEYGRYVYIGWTTNDNLHATAEDNLDESDCVSLENITANTTFYPVFEGEYVEYGVVFHSLDNTPLTREQKVEHGKFATYRVGGVETNDYYPDPTRDEDVVNTYSFAGWITAYDSSAPIETKNIENTPIYGPVTFFPSFAPTKKDYTVEFRDASKNLMQYKDGGETKDAIFEGIHLETNLLDTNAPAGIAKLAPEKESDNTYFYTWSGKWQVLREDGSLGKVVDLRNLSVTVNDIVETKDKNGTVLSRTIRLVPVFEQTLIRYAVDIEMGVPFGEDMNYYRGEAEVQVIANNGQLVAVGKTEANGKFRCYLNYQIPFTVNVASYEGKYIGSAIITSLAKSPKGDEDEAANYNHVLVAMEKNPEYETHCSCIHHVSLLQPLVVGIFNILYNWFNYKYVCCYDMYSTIGPLLAYTAD